MKTTIDSAGRIVVPKPMRDELGLRGGETLEVVLRDGRLEIEVSPMAVRLADVGEGPVAVTDSDVAPLTAEIVRATLERLRR